jgi:DNA-binding response OmpR family regulator
MKKNDMALPRILVVDDDNDLLDMMCVLLETAGFNAECISNENQLYPCITASRPDLLLMDIYLHAADGRDLCRELKNNPLYAKIPVILYSAGHITAASIESSKADAFVVKPFDINMMIEKIRYHLVQPA